MRSSPLNNPGLAVTTPGDRRLKAREVYAVQGKEEIALADPYSLSSSPLMSSGKNKSRAVLKKISAHLQTGGMLSQERLAVTLQVWHLQKAVQNQ